MFPLLSKRLLASRATARRKIIPSSSPLAQRRRISRLDYLSYAQPLPPSPSPPPPPPPRTYFQHPEPLQKPRWRNEPRWVRWTIYTASAMTIALFYTFYKNREPIYVSRRMVLNMIPDEELDYHIEHKNRDLLNKVGIAGLESWLSERNTVKRSEVEYACLRDIFDCLMRAGGLEDVVDLELHLVDSDHFMESKLNTDTWNIIVHRGELPAAMAVDLDEAISSLASMLAPRIARKALNHQGEMLNNFIFSCFVTVPAILFGGAALRSKTVRVITTPFFWYYSGFILSINTWMKYRQLNEETYVSLLIMSRAGYDPAEAINYRKRQVERGEQELEVQRMELQNRENGVLKVKDVVMDTLQMTPLHKWIDEQRRYGRAVKRLLPRVESHEKMYTEQAEDGEKSGEKSDDEESGDGHIEKGAGK